MAEKELRKMSRTELIEIIYALKTNEDDLNKKNETLKAQLEQHKIDIEEADALKEQTQAECQQIKEQTNEEIKKRWTDFENRVHEYLNKYQELSILLEHFGGVS